MIKGGMLETKRVIPFYMLVQKREKKTPHFQNPTFPVQATHCKSHLLLSCIISSDFCGSCKNKTNVLNVEL